jgi:hypothetical protein
MNYEIVRREAQRLAMCRGCDEGIKKGEELVYTYSWRNRGQSIYFCISCAKKIGDLVKEKNT